MHKLFYIFLLGLMLVSCDKNKIYEQYVDIPEGLWDAESPAVFDVEIADTIQPLNVLMNFRTAKEYPYQNLYIFLTTVFPDGNIAQDTMEFYFMDNKGKPLGDCTGQVCNYKFMVMQGIRFPLTGLYTFRVHQAMRTPDNQLPDMLNVGMRIEKSTMQRQ
jgi:gliding motility-associated lipoprotein GldH